MEGFAFILFMLVLFWVLANAFSNGGRRSQGAASRHDTPSVFEGRASPAAVSAMRRAGYQRGPRYVDVTDLGLLTYRGERDTMVVRAGAVDVDADYLRPFAELWLPYRARGAVRFELWDDSGRLRYADEAPYDLDQGQNMLFPRTWLPLQGKQFGAGEWMLGLRAGDTLLAVHRFGWRRASAHALQPLIEDDGELSPELVAAVRESARQAVSLDDLLAS